MTSVFGGAQTVPQLTNTSQTFDQTAQTAQNQTSAQTYSAGPWAQIPAGYGANWAGTINAGPATGPYGVPLLDVAPLTGQQQQAIGSIYSYGLNNADFLFPQSQQSIAGGAANMNAAAGYYPGAANMIGQGAGYFPQAAGMMNYGTGYLGAGGDLVSAGAGYLPGSAAMIAGGMPYISGGGSMISEAGTPITAGDVQGFYNPMAANITANLQDIFNQQNLAGRIGATSATGGVGGDRAAVAQALMAKQQGLAAGQTYADLYNRALQAAQQQKVQQLQAGLGYAGLGPAMGALGAQYGNLAGMYGGLGGQLAGIGSAFGGMGAQYGGLGTQLGGLGSQYAGVGSQLGQLGGQQQALGYTGMQTGYGGLQQALQAAALQQQQQQAQNQAYYQYQLGHYQDPFLRFGALTGAISPYAGLGGTGITSGTSAGTYGQFGTQAGTGQQQTTYPAPPLFSQLAGLGTLGLGIGSIFSDKRNKTDVQKVGKDRASGLPMYAYRYKGDPKSYPKVVGPMAQDVAKKYPSAVKKFQYGGEVEEGDSSSDSEQANSRDEDTNWMDDFTDPSGRDIKDPKKNVSTDKWNRTARAIRMAQKYMQQSQVARPRVSPITFPATPWKSGAGSFRARGGRLAIDLPALARAIQSEGGRVNRTTVPFYGAFPSIYRNGGIIRGYQDAGEVTADDSDPVPDSGPEPAGLPDPSYAEDTGDVPLPVARPSEAPLPEPQGPPAPPGLGFQQQQPPPPDSGGGGGGAGGGGGRSMSPGAMALIQAGLGMLAASGQRDARGLPMSPLAAIGKGGMMGVENYQEQQQIAAKEALARQAQANIMMRHREAQALRQQALNNLEAHRAAQEKMWEQEKRRPIKMMDDKGNEYLVHPGTGERIGPAAEKPPGTAFTAQDIPPDEAPVETNQRLNAQGSAFDYSTGAPGKIEKGMDVPVPAPVGNFSSRSVQQHGELYFETGQLPPVARGNNPVAVRQQRFREAVMNYGNSMAAQLGMSIDEVADQWRSSKSMPTWLRMPQGGIATAATGTVMQHIRALDDIYKAMRMETGEAKSQFVNDLLTRINKQFGGKAAQSLEMASQLVGTELIRALGVSGGGALADREEAQRNWQGKLTSDQWDYQKGQILKLLGGRLMQGEKLAGEMGVSAKKFKRIVGDDNYKEVMGSTTPGAGAEKPDVWQGGIRYRWNSAEGKYKAVQ